MKYEIHRTNFTHETRCTFQLGHSKLQKSCHASETPVAPVVTNTCSTEILKLPIQKQRGGEKKKISLHSPLVLSHKLGGELAEDVQESQVAWGASFSLGTRLLKCKLNTIPEKSTEAERKRKTCEQGLATFCGH